MNDYENSLIGTFTKLLLETIQKDEKLNSTIEVYFTITKFQNDIGYSLMH